MASQEFYGLEGKLRRTVYAIVFQDMITNVTTLKEEDVKYLMKKIKSAVNDAVENSLEYMVEHEIIETQSKSRKKKKSNRFDARKFTPAKVRAWIDAHGGRGKGFQVEPATSAYDRVGEVYAGNPVTLKSWLMKMYREEKQGIKEYEKLYWHVGKSKLKNVLKRIIADEKKHARWIVEIYRNS